MDSAEASTQSFIIKIWLEEPADAVGSPTWRGRITHVSDGRYRYLKSLDDMAPFVAAYLEGLGVKLDTGWRVRQWLKQWLRRLARP